MSSPSLLLHKLHDSLARHVFGRPQAAAIELRHVLPPPLLATLDLTTLTRLPSDTTRPSRGERVSDMLFHVALRDRGDPPIRVAIDHQSTPQPLLPWRSLVYSGEQWGSYIKSLPRPPRTLPFVLPVLIVQPPALPTPSRLSDILDLPADLRATFGAPFEVALHIDDLSGSVLQDPVAHRADIALVEATRILLFAYKNENTLTIERLAYLGSLFDLILDHFGPGEVHELLDYVLGVFGAGSPIHAIIMQTFARETREMYMTLADEFEAKGLTKGLTKGRAEGKAEAVLGVLAHRRLDVPQAVREQVLATADEPVLQRWFDRAFTATTATEIFDHHDA